MSPEVELTSSYIRDSRERAASAQTDGADRSSSAGPSRHAFQN